MKVRQLMTRPVRTCGPRDSLERAAQLLWEHDCGALPVVDEENRVHALITDRDICMGAYTSGKRLADLTVADSMSRSVTSCHPDDDVGVAAQRMAANAVRRLPVVDDKGHVQGIVSLADLARASDRDAVAAQAASRVLTTVSLPRPVAEAPPAAAAPSGHTRSRRAPASPNTARGAVLLGGKSDAEC